MHKGIVNWLKSRVRLAKSKGIVLGLSGGIDSSLCLALCKQAVGKSRVMALMLPIHSDPKDAIYGRLIAEKLGIKAKTIDLSAIYDGLIKLLPVGNKIARANLKPRLRMLVLYYFANKFNYLVCGTGNKSEFMAGYFTKYGDGACDILPLGDLLKRQVKVLARDLDIPQCIIAKAPTAGLWPGQTDEGEMGLAYSELDEILSRLENKTRQVSPSAKVSKVKNMIKRSAHKRQGPLKP